MTFLSKKLERYYYRKKNKITFRNGMNLSELAIAMWEKLGYREIDSSVISRVLQGERLLSFKQLKVFCEILRISQQEIYSLLDSLHTELSFKFGVEEIFYAREVKNLTDSAVENMGKISIIKERGYPNLALIWMDDVAEKIKLGLTQSHDSLMRKLLNELLAKLLIEKVFCIYESAYENDSIQRVFNVSRKLDEINIELRDPKVSAFSKFSKGGAYYVKKSYKSAIPFLREAVSMPLDEAVRIQAFRELAVSYAASGNNESNEIIQLLMEGQEKYSYDLRFQIIEGVARSYSEAHDEYNALKTLEEAKKILEQIEFQTQPYVELRKIQLIRTELEIYDKNKLKKNSNYIDKISQEGVKLALTHGYLRHKENIEELTQNLQT